MPGQVPPSHTNNSNTLRPVDQPKLAWMQAALAVLSAVLKAIFDAYRFAASLGQHEQGPAVSIIVPVGLCCCVASSWKSGLPVILLGHVWQISAWPLISCTCCFFMLSAVRK